jgi:hypothetical protein
MFAVAAPSGTIGDALLINELQTVMQQFLIIWGPLAPACPPSISAGKMPAMLV